jgi:hypothetical protein
LVLHQRRDETQPLILTRLNIRWSIKSICLQ